MDNIYFKKLPGDVVPAVTGDDAVIVETNAGALTWADAAGNKELADKTWASGLFLTTDAAEAAYAPKQFTDANGAINYIGQDLSLTVSSGTHVITNCTGTITVSGNNATVYVSNSPGLTIAGVTLDNWDKVYRDGLASYAYPLNIVRTLNTITTNEIINTEVTAAAYKADKRILRMALLQTDFAAVATDLVLAYNGTSGETAYNGMLAYSLSNGAATFPNWVSMSFFLDNAGLGFGLAPYPASPNLSVTLYELYLEKRS